MTILLKRDIIALLIIIVLIASVLGLIYFGPAFIVMKKNFSFETKMVSAGGYRLNSVELINTIGATYVRSWSNAFLMINGTVSARGLGADPNLISLYYSDFNGAIVFEPSIPSTSNFLFANPYSVDINLYIPTAAYLASVSVSTSIGAIQVSSINATTIQVDGGIGKISATSVAAISITMGDVSGDIDFSCSCDSASATTVTGSVTATLTHLPDFGNYAIATTNGNVNLSLPASGNFTITPNTSNGIVSSTGLSDQLRNHVASRFGTGAATVTTSTKNGSIVVSGNQ